MMVFWSAWLLLIVVTFAIAEGYALRNDKPTLSQYIWRLSKAWPLFPFIAGALTGGLAVHFWWGGSTCFVGCAASPVSP